MNGLPWSSQFFLQVTNLERHRDMIRNYNDTMDAEKKKLVFLVFFLPNALHCSLESLCTSNKFPSLKSLKSAIAPLLDMNANSKGSTDTQASANWSLASK